MGQILGIVQLITACLEKQDAQENGFKYTKGRVSIIKKKPEGKMYIGPVVNNNAQDGMWV